MSSALATKDPGLLSLPHSNQGGVIDFNEVDTTTGMDHLYPFAPPFGWSGESEQYKELIRSRYRDLLHGQRMGAIARYSKTHDVRVVGPYAEAASEILAAIRKPGKSKNAITNGSLRLLSI